MQSAGAAGRPSRARGAPPPRPDRPETLRVVETDATGAKLFADRLRRQGAGVRLLDARRCRTRTQLVAELGGPSGGRRGGPSTIVFSHAGALLEADDDTSLAALLDEVQAGESGRTGTHRAFVLAGTASELDALSRRVRSGGGELPRREPGPAPAAAQRALTAGDKPNRSGAPGSGKPNRAGGGPGGPKPKRGAR